jgi:pimeloyl-ACP methyl ester carboxylesterase
VVVTTHDLRTFDLHGQDLAYVDAGGGPAVVLIHGLMSSHATWGGQIDRLAVEHRVIAPDLPGNGASGKALGDYSLSAHAAAVRDLLDHLGVHSAVVVGHSLGGGVAMQFAYLFPERVDRMALVSSGGLGREISPALRAAILPGSEYVLPVITSRPVRVVGDRLLALSDKFGLLPPSESSRAAWRDLASLADAETRRAFLATSRGVIDPGGQTVSALSRLQEIADRPLLAVWGAKDRVLPVSQVRSAFAEFPGARIEIFERSGHFPHLDEPDRFAAVLSEFVDTETAADGSQAS